MIAQSFLSLLNPISIASGIVMTHGYVIIFIAMILEGPIITSTAALAASLGYLDIFLIFILSLLGDFIGDILHYWAGRLLRRAIIERFVNYLGIRRSTVKRLEKKIHNNLWKSMTLIKTTPPISTPGLLLIGASRAPFSRYLVMSLITTLPLTIFYTSLGFFFGSAIKSVLSYFKIGQYLILVVIIALILVILFYRFLFKKILKWFGN